MTAPAVPPATPLRPAAPEPGAPALRSYQRAALEGVLDARARGRRRVLIVLPTGAGKTVVFAALPRALGAERTLVLAHRKELLDQAAEKLRQAEPTLKVCVEQATRRADPDADVVVASIATLARLGGDRLARLDPRGFSLVIVDEAHHATAETYQRVLEAAGAFDPESDTFVVGTTATAERGDGVGLEKIFQEIAYERSLAALVEDGWLAPVLAYRIVTGTDLTGVRSTGGDFAEAALGERLNNPERNAVIVDAYLRHAAGRRGLAFTAGVQHAHDLAAAFVTGGVAAEAVWGGMDPLERAATLARFQRGETEVVANAQLLLEGYDLPEVSAILMGRPTRSPVLYRQAVGRGLRRAPGKRDCVLLDFCDTTRHALCAAASLCGLPPETDPRGRDLREVRKAEAQGYAGRLEELSPREWRAFLVDLGARHDSLAARPRRLSTLPWVAVGVDHYTVELPRARRLEVRGDVLGAWRLRVWERGREVAEGAERFASLGQALRKIHDWLAAALTSDLAAVVRRPDRRYAPATQEQRSALLALGLAPPAELTWEQASELWQALTAARWCAHAV